MRHLLVCARPFQHPHAEDGRPCRFHITIFMTPSLEPERRPADPCLRKREREQASHGRCGREGRRALRPLAWRPRRFTLNDDYSPPSPLFFLFPSTFLFPLPPVSSMASAPPAKSPLPEQDFATPSSNPVRRRCWRVETAVTRIRRRRRQRLIPFSFFARSLPSSRCLAIVS